MFIVLCQRSMVIYGVSLKPALEQNSRDSAVNLKPVMAQTVTQITPRMENQESTTVKGKAKCLKRKSLTNPKLLMNFVI